MRRREFTEELKCPGGRKQGGQDISTGASASEPAVEASGKGFVDTEHDEEAVRAILGEVLGEIHEFEVGRSRGTTLKLCWSPTVYRQLHIRY